MIHPVLPPPRRLNHLLGNYAGFASRATAMVIDMLLLSVTVVFVAWFVSTTVKMLQLKTVAMTLAETSPVLQRVIDFIFGPATYSIVSVSFVIFYYLFFWTIAGQTIGKAIMGIRIVSQDGHKLKLTQSIVRYIGYFISTIAFGMGFLSILIDDHRLAWHDKLAKTCVLYAWDAHPDETFLVEATEQMVSQRRIIRSIAKQLRHIGRSAPTPQLAAMDIEMPKLIVAISEQTVEQTPAESEQPRGQ